MPDEPKMRSEDVASPYDVSERRARVPKGDKSKQPKPADGKLPGEPEGQRE